jgi:hypothetical protein
MKIWKDTVWSPWALGSLKWSAMSFGIIVGAFFPEFVRQHLWVFIAAMLLLAIKPTMTFLRGDD